MERGRKRQWHRVWEGMTIIHVDPGKTERHTGIKVPSWNDVYELENSDISTHYPYKMRY